MSSVCFRTQKDFLCLRRILPLSTVCKPHHQKIQKKDFLLCCILSLADCWLPTSPKDRSDPMKIQQNSRKSKLVVHEQLLVVPEYICSELQLANSTLYQMILGRAATLPS
jgi:hypothetical protein